MSYKKSLSYQPAIMVRIIRTLNEDERNGLRVALEDYIIRHPNAKDHFVQRILLDEMLPVLMWGSE